MTKHESSDWAKLANYRTGFDADVARATLEAADILVQLRGNQTGIFGPGFQGPVLGGIDLLVPTVDLERALELLEE